MSADPRSHFAVASATYLLCRVHGAGLYHPQYGYYARNCAQLGFRGDFVTSVHLSNDFGELLADQFAEMWGKLHHPKPFHLVEMGPGQGLLADVILSQLQTQHPDCLAAIHYTLIEKSAA